jgi:hypothetical protein
MNKESQENQDPMLQTPEQKYAVSDSHVDKIASHCPLSVQDMIFVKMTAILPD